MVLDDAEVCQDWNISINISKSKVFIFNGAGKLMKKIYKSKMFSHVNILEYSFQLPEN